MTIEERVIQVLENSVTARIRFTFPGMRGRTVQVDKSTFERVANAIHQKKITVAEGSLGQKVDGQFDYESNVLTLRPFSHTREWEATVVHEAVHASMDLTRSCVLNADNETAGYLASAMYFAMTGFPKSRYFHEAGWEQLLHGAVRKILRTGAVDAQTIDPMRNRLFTSKTYAPKVGKIDNPRIFLGNGGNR